MSNHVSLLPKVRLDAFIVQAIEPIMAEWEAFARTRIPAAATMSMVALRDHAELILRAVAADMASPQTESARSLKSKGLAASLDAETAATTHGALRHLDGFDLVQVASEYRALRAAVLRQWAEYRPPEVGDVEDITRFNEGIDQALAESIAAYSMKIDESRDTFLAVLGHDLRGPLSAISNCIELAQRPSLAAERRERMFHVAARSVASMNDLITDLLEYTKTRLGRGIEVVRTEGNFAAFCEEVVDEARVGHARRHFNYTSSGARAVLYDADRMRQVLSNLLNNAVQHGDPRSPVNVDVAEEDAEVRIAVSNRGVPIPSDALQVIFNPLVQVAKTTTELHERPSTSMGLGLFIALEIVKAHAGTIEVASTREAGTVFTVRLPKMRSPDESLDLTSGASNLRTTGRELGRGCSILECDSPVRSFVAASGRRLREEGLLYAQSRSLEHSSFGVASTLRPVPRPGNQRRRDAAHVARAVLSG